MKFQGSLPYGKLQFLSTEKCVYKVILNQELPSNKLGLGLKKQPEGKGVLSIQKTRRLYTLYMPEKETCPKIPEVRRKDQLVPY